MAPTSISRLHMEFNINVQCLAYYINNTPNSKHSIPSDTSRRGDQIHLYKLLYLTSAKRDQIDMIKSTRNKNDPH